MDAGLGGEGAGAHIWRLPVGRAVEQFVEGARSGQGTVTYANGDKETLYFRDFNSGAMLENIVARAKKTAIKEYLETGQKGIRVAHLLTACIDEFRENEDLPNTTNPDDWARISGKKGERIVFIRTLVAGKQGTEAGRSIESIANTGQYL
jgi:proteasome-associated ATPase